jgi:hypothetical protein
MDAGLSCEPTNISQWEIGIGHSVELSIGESSHSKCAESASLANPNPSFEHVGVNDECLYIDIGPTPPIPTSQSLDDEVEEEEVEEDDFWMMKLRKMTLLQIETLHANQMLTMTRMILLWQ